MANTDFKSVDQYLARLPESVQEILQRVRAAIGKAVPQAQETISYQIPAFKLHGRPMVYFAGWKQHYSIYPSTPGLVAAFEKELAPYEVTKGTIRFPLTQRVPLMLIRRIAKFRAKEVADGEKKRASASKRQ